jgi:hypothetical protein
MIGFSLLALSIVRREDVADSQYRVSERPEIVQINPGGNSRRSANHSAEDFNVECAGTMISPKHAITAAHCFEDGARKHGFNVRVNGERCKAAATHFNPHCVFRLHNDGPNRCDTAIVELDEAVATTYMPVYQWDDETGKHMTIYGCASACLDPTTSDCCLAAAVCSSRRRIETFRCRGRHR